LAEVGNLADGEFTSHANVFCRFILMWSVSTSRGNKKERSTGFRQGDRMSF
jgi:hypothetical protein